METAPTIEFMAPALGASDGGPAPDIDDITRCLNDLKKGIFRHLAEQVPVIEHVTPARDAVRAACALVVGYLAPDLESSSSSAALAAATSNDDINEKLTSTINMFDSQRDLCSSSVALLDPLLPMQHPCELLRNAADVHSSPFAWGLAGHGLPGSRRVATCTTRLTSSV